MATNLEYIESLGLSAALKTRALGALDNVSGRSERTPVTRNTLFLATTNIYPNLLFMRFGGDFAPGEIDYYVQVWGLALKLLKMGQANIDRTKQYNWWFGRETKTTKVKRVFKTTSSELREEVVVQKFKEMLSEAGEPWVLRPDAAEGTLASAMPDHKRDMKVGGFGQRSAMFVATVVVHEMGHNSNLVDVCDICDKDAIELAKKHFAKTVKLFNCGQLNHGGNQYIGSERARLLATDCRNLSVYNCDSYRWYCASFYVDEVLQGVGGGTSEAQLAQLGKRLRGEL